MFKKIFYGLVEVAIILLFGFLGWVIWRLPPESELQVTQEIWLPECEYEVFKFPPQNPQIYLSAYKDVNLEEFIKMDFEKVILIIGQPVLAYWGEKDGTYYMVNIYDHPYGTDTHFLRLKNRELVGDRIRFEYGRDWFMAILTTIVFEGLLLVLIFTIWAKLLKKKTS